LNIAAQKYAEILLEAVCCLYSQHISGTKNNVADSFSQWHDLTDDELTNFICTTYLSQAPGYLTIYHLPPEISSWATYWLQKCSKEMESQKTWEIRNLDSGNDGWNMQDLLSSSKTYGSKASHLNGKQKSLELLQLLYKDDSTISHQCSGNSIEQGEMCPVRAAAETIKRIYAYNLPHDNVKDTQISILSNWDPHHMQSLPHWSLWKYGRLSSSWAMKNWDSTQATFRRRNGDVHHGNACINSNAYGALVIRCVHEIPQKTGTLIEPWHFDENAYLWRILHGTWFYTYRGRWRSENKN